MPKREDETAREFYYGGHPPTCTCKYCTENRLKGKSTHFTKSEVTLSDCPKCGEKSLFYNGKEGRYECLNRKCKVTGRTKREIRFGRYVAPTEKPRPIEKYPQAEKKPTTTTPISSSKSEKQLITTPNWIKVAVLSILPILVIALIIYFNWVGITSPIITTPAPSLDSADSLQKITVSVQFSHEKAEDIIFDLINNEREEAGVHPLECSEYLDKLAREHSQHMAFEEDYEFSDYNYCENIGWCIGIYTEEGVAQTIIRTWTEHSRDEENLLDTEIDTCGIGVFKKEASVFVTYLAD